MPEELQNLLDRIQKDGVDKAEAEKEKRIAAAKEEAKTIVDEAEKKAADLLAKAETDAQAFEERAKVSLQQAARDVVLSVGDAVTATFEQIAAEEITGAISGDALEKMLIEVVQAYCSETADDTRITVLVGEAQQKQVTDLLMAKCREKMEKGIDIQSDKSLAAGFRVSMDNGDVEHDFSAEAATEAMCQLLRPHIAEIVKKATTKE